MLTRIARVAAAASEQCYEEVLHCVVSHVWHAWSPAGALAAPAPFLQPRAVDAASSGAVPGWVGSDAQAAVASSHMLNMTVLYTGFNVVDTTAIFQSLRARVEKTWYVRTQDECLWVHCLLARVAVGAARTCRCYCRCECCSRGGPPRAARAYLAPRALQHALRCHA
ncbi:MAG: hypothetical protein EOO41_04950 [Methanobacteriota archaeon]|nr:MAG: hypothetical protein EOO41_04950 [Euryarchaeota archaeon]